MHFRSVADLNTDIHASLHLFPRDIDAVIGIPRSGMLPAAIIALALNVPMGDLHGFARGQLLGVGSKRTTARSSAGFADV